MKWTRTTVKLENHVIVPNLDPDIKNPDQFVEDYVSNLTKNAMDMSQPLWELHLLNIKTSDAEAVGVFESTTQLVMVHLSLHFSLLVLEKPQT